MQRKEAELQKKLAKIDSLAGSNLVKNTQNKYEQLQNKLSGTRSLTKYIPQLDTLSNSFRFLEENQQWLTNVKDAKDKLSEASSRLQELQGKLQNAEDIKQFLKERKEYLKQQLEKFGFAKELKKITRETYYFSQQVNEYREILKDSKKAERKAIELLTKSKAFRDFMKNNSFLAGLFRFPDPADPGYQANVAGLQTRAQVNQLIQNQFGTGGTTGQQSIQQNIQHAKSQIDKLKEKINKLGGGSSDEELPDFKPNNQKTKGFLKRLEIGTNIQSQRSNALLPLTTDLGFSVGYKLNNNGVVGIGGSYKIGWGSGWNNIRISYQGAGLRSYIDWKLKGDFFISGGYELNYLPELANLVINTRGGNLLTDPNQQSGLIGISKIISIKSKLFKKSRAQLLWDFLSYQQVPRSQAILFRISYNIK